MEVIVLVSTIATIRHLVSGRLLVIILISASWNSCNSKFFNKFDKNGY